MEHSFYATVAQGYRAGGVRAAPDSGFLNRQVQISGAPAGLDTRSFYDKEKVTNYEIGWHGIFHEGRTRVDGALFWMDWTDMQVTTARVACVLPDGRVVEETSATALAAGAACVGPVPDNRVRNAKAARARGVELSAFTRIFPQFEFAGSVGFNDAKFVSFKDSVNGDVSGSRLPSAPKWSVAMSATYRFNLRQMDGYLRVSATHKSSFATNFRGVEGTTGGVSQFPFNTKSATVAHLSAGITWFENHLSLVVNNLFEEDYTTAATGFSGLGATILPHPRTVSLNLSRDVNF